MNPLFEHEVLADLDLTEETAALSTGVDLHVVTAGTGTPIVLLHGFPEFWFSWRHQIKPLVDAGFRVICPDMRGYNKSSKPRSVSDYHIDKLAADVAALIAFYGYDSAHVAAHDWGGAIAWHFAAEHPENLNQLAILNVPHMTQMQAGLRTVKQLRKSWYMFMFQLPLYPERDLLKNNGAGIRRIFRHDPVNPDAFDETEIDAYVDAFARPGAAKAALNYYRCAARTSWWIKPKEILAPVLVVWGERDTALGKELAQPPAEMVPNATVVRLPNASHWVQVDAPAEVNRELIAFFEL